MKEQMSASAEVLSIREIKDGSGIFLFRLRVPGIEKIKIKAGQFVTLRPLNSRRMRRPFSVVKIVGDVIYLIIEAVGGKSSNTRLYAKLQPGAEMEICGPCGQGFELPPENNLIFASGGTGEVGLYSLVKDAIEAGKNIRFLKGARTEQKLLGNKILIDFGIFPTDIQSICDDTPVGGGKVTDLLREVLAPKKRDTAVIACGPRPMLKAVNNLCAEYGVPCFVSVEVLMACGTGACLGCAIKMTDKTFKQACKHGPIFPADKIDWSEFVVDSEITVRSEKVPPSDPLSTTFHGKDGRTLKLRVPITNGSGCFDEEAARKFGGCLDTLFTKTVTLEERPGNRGPRICETDCGGMINSIGLANVGVKRFIREKWPLWQALGKQIIINIAGSTSMNYIEVVEELNSLPCAGFEINISCPNVKEGGMAFGTNPDIAARVVRGVRQATDKFLIVKLTPNVANVVEIGLAVEDAGADAVSAINTLKGMIIDTQTFRPRIGSNYGGYSGHPIMPVAVADVSMLFHSKLKIPIIGGGGITGVDDAAQFMLAGAAAVFVGTETFPNQHVFEDIRNGLPEFLECRGLSHVSQLTGKVKMF